MHALLWSDTTAIDTSCASLVPSCFLRQLSKCRLFLVRHIRLTASGSSELGYCLSPCVTLFSTNFWRHCRRMPRGSPLTRHLSAGDAVVQLGECAVASRADWAACLAARAVPGNGDGECFCVPEAAVLDAAPCNAPAAAAGEAACQPDELCWVAQAGARTGSAPSPMALRSEGACLATELCRGAQASELPA